VRGRIPPCARSYALALSNPHALLGYPAPCIPDSLATPSFRYYTRSRSEFTVGTLGAGGAAVWPYRCGVNGALSDGANNCYQIAATTSAYAVNNASFASVDRGVVAGVDGTISPASMFTPAFFGNTAGGSNRALRLVGSGVKVSYTGSVTNQAGTITFIRNPAASNTLNVNLDQLAELLNQGDAIRIPIRDLAADDDNGVAYAPRTPDDAAQTPDPMSASRLQVGNASILTNRLGYAVFVSGCTPGTVFSIDVVSWFEAYGPGLPLTTTDVVTGTEAAIAATSVTAVPLSAQPSASGAATMRALSAKILGSAASGMADAAVPIIRNVARNMVISAASGRPRPGQQWRPVVRVADQPRLLLH